MSRRNASGKFLKRQLRDTLPLETAAERLEIR